MANEKKAFVEGSTVNVWKKTGVRRLKYGVQTSERPGGDFPDIETNEALTVVKKLGSGKAVCRRQNGQEIIVHKNHIDKDAKYYAVRLAEAAKEAAESAGGSANPEPESAGPNEKIPSTPQERLQAAHEAMDRARLEYDEALKQIEEVEAELSSQDLPEVNEDEIDSMKKVG